jgi:hypothetical protein
MAVAMDGKEGLLDKLAAFGRCVESSSLYIVLAIDSTIGSLQEVDQIARALALSCESMAHEISMNPLIAGCLLDPAGKVVDDLWACHQRIDELVPGLIAQSSQLAKMDVPDQRQRDLLSFAFERCVESFTWVIDGVRKVRQMIDTHNLAAEPGPVKDADAASPASLQSNAA